MIDWLMRDEQKTLFELVVAIVLNILFLALSALLLWPLDKIALTMSLAKGYGLFWIVFFLISIVVFIIARMFRLSPDSHFDAYVLLNLSVSAFLVMGWSAFVALALRDALADAPIWVAVILCIVSLVASWVGYVIVSALFQGQIYRQINLVLVGISFVVFAIWPTLGRLMYGWFFALF